MYPTPLPSLLVHSLHSLSVVDDRSESRRALQDEIPLGGSACHGASSIRVMETAVHTGVQSPSNLSNKLKRMSSDCQWVL